jgi:hypothetical protein
MPDATATKRQPPCWISFRTDAEGRKQPWPRPPKAPLFERPMPARPRHVTPYEAGQRDPMEMLARLAGMTTFRTPGAGRATVPTTLTTSDIAGALGYVRDPLAQRMARAVACQATDEWPTVQALAVPPLRALLLAKRETRSLVQGHRKLRVRLVLHVAFHDLVLLRRPRWRDGALAISMREQDYRALHDAATGFLMTHAVSGAFAARAAVGVP